jgi:hypothetical protein
MKGRLGCFLIAAVIGLFWAGGQNFYTGITNRTPTKATVAEYAKTRPTAHWLHLTGARLMITDAMYRTSSKGASGSVQELFIPVRAEPDGAGTCVVLFSTKDAGLMTLHQQLQSASTKEQAIGFLQHHKDKIFNREIKGLVRYGIDLKDEERRKLANLDKSLAPDFIILNDGAEPSMAAGIGMLAGGAVLAGLGAVFARRSG